MRQRLAKIVAFALGAILATMLAPLEAQGPVTPWAQIGLRASDGALSVTNVGDCGTLGPITAAANLGVRASNGALQVCGAGGGGGGAPTDATYVTQTPNGSLSAEQALSLLSSGIMRVATTTGAITALTDSAGIAANLSDETGTGALVFGTSPAFTTGIVTPQVIGDAVGLSLSADSESLGLTMIADEDESRMYGPTVSLFGTNKVGFTQNDGTYATLLEMMTEASNWIVYGSYDDLNTTFRQFQLSTDLISLRMMDNEGIDAIASLVLQPTGNTTADATLSASGDVWVVAGDDVSLEATGSIISYSPYSEWGGDEVYLSAYGTGADATVQSSDGHVRLNPKFSGGTIIVNGSSGVTATTCTQFTKGLCTAGSESDPLVLIAALRAEIAELRAIVAAQR